VREASVAAEAWPELAAVRASVAAWVREAALVVVAVPVRAAAAAAGGVGVRPFFPA